MVVAQLQQHVVAKNSKTSLETSSADGKTLVPVSEMGRITCDMEFRFMLHRHWSLYEVSLLADGVSPRSSFLVGVVSQFWRGASRVSGMKWANSGIVRQCHLEARGNIAPDTPCCWFHRC